MNIGEQLNQYRTRMEVLEKRLSDNDDTWTDDDEDEWRFLDQSIKELERDFACLPVGRLESLEK